MTIRYFILNLDFRAGVVPSLAVSPLHSLELELFRLLQSVHYIPLSVVVRRLLAQVLAPPVSWLDAAAVVCS